MTDVEKAKEYIKRRYPHIMSKDMKEFVKNIYLAGLAEGRKSALTQDEKNKKSPEN